MPLATNVSGVSEPAGFGAARHLPDDRLWRESVLRHVVERERRHAGAVFRLVDDEVGLDHALDGSGRSGRRMVIRMANLKAREGHDAQVRRDGVEQLAAATRALADAVAETGVDRATLDEVTGALGAAHPSTPRSRSTTTRTPGLVIKPVDYSIPEGPMPLNPIIGACSPVRPDVELRFADGEVVGTATFTKRFVGPPGYAHGGISAMLADQIVAASPLGVGVRTITRSLELRYLRPLPLDEEVELWGVCEPVGDGFRARFTLTARGEVAVEGTAELVHLRGLRQARRHRSKRQ